MYWASLTISSVVALRTEGVDRNLLTQADVTAPAAVALRTEGVDRNHELECLKEADIGRPPHGGRG